MKKIVLALFGIISFLSLSAQSNFGLVEGANWQQYISTLLGGNCVEISNVQYNAGSNSAGYFVNGNNVIGINKGIVISTGRVYSTTDTITISSHHSNFIIGQNNLPGDAIITQLAGTNSYDAVVLEFDFTAPASDSVFVRYVFASEEYPEFAPPNNSFFNDMFGFFVSGGGYLNQNIALVPGTSTPVSINSINAITNTAYYLSEHPNLVYDGFTVPLTAKFYAVANQTYHLKIVIADVGDNAFDSAVFLEALELGIQQIAGTALLNGQPLTSGVVELFGLNTDSTQANLVASQDLTTGDFVFSNLEPASYILKVTPDATDFPGALPKYYDQAYLWADATILSLPCSDYSFGLSLAPVPNGSGTVSGTVYSTTSTLRVTQDFDDFQPVANKDVWLFSTIGNQPIAIKRTNSNGIFTFENIEAGVYYVVVDVPGLPIEDRYEFSLSENETKTNIDYLVGKNKIVKYDQQVGINSLKFSHARVYPNPFNQYLNVSGMPEAEYLLELTDMSGRVVLRTYQKLTAYSELLNLPLDKVSQGMYVLSFTSAQGRFQTRLLK